MTYDEIDLPRTVPLADAARAIEESCEAEGLRVVSRGPSVTHPGSIRWNVKKGREPGAMEITLFNRERRILLSVAENRVGPWSEATLERISETLINRLQRSSPAKSAGSGHAEAEPEGGTTL
ncbi:MAG: hypothetical protein V4671_08635 [Armatimonadota bacterium]